MRLKPQALLFLLLATFGILLSPAWAQAKKDTSPNSEATLVAETVSVQPGVPFTVALRLQMDAHWHSYWRNPGDSGTPTTIKWNLPAGFKAGPIQWPHPEKIVLPPLVSYGYENEVLLLTEITPSKTLSPETNVTLKARAEWLICKHVCLPAEQQVSLQMPVKAQPSTANSRWAQKFAQARANFARPATQLGYQTRAERGLKTANASQPSTVLHITPPAGVTLSPETFKDAYFFASDASTIAHAAPQRMTQTGDGLQIVLAPSEYAYEPVKRLRGVLLAPRGRAWDSENQVRALAIDIPVDAAGSNAVAAQQPREATGAAGTTGAMSGGSGNSAVPLTIGAALLLAFGGGLLLNLMPCVFPVLSLKILNFVQQSNHNQSKIRRHGLAFGAGVLVSFWVLAGGLLTLRAAGGGVGWGYQLQSPLFVAALALLLFAVGLNLLGAFEIGVGMTGLVGKTATAGKTSSYGSSFASGVLATVVATPCTAPFMGAALGYALTQPAVVAMLVFTVLGLGVATPYVLLSLNPSWLRVLPRPGAWMESLKQFMAFPMFATALWLVWVFGLQTGMNGAAMLLGAFLLLGMAIWLLSRWSGAAASSTRWLTRSVAAITVVLALFVVWRGASELPDAVVESASLSADESKPRVTWQRFSVSKVAELRAAGRPCLR
jgi:thiol:disulfide interchange protein DsbD